MAIEHILVVGAGQMGAGIAQVALTAGLKVTLSDVAREALDKGADKIRGGLAKLVEKGKLDDAKRKAALESLRTATAVAEAKDVDFAVEAVTENEELKKRIFRDLDQVVRPGGVLATNTSSIPITRVAAVTRRPESVIGMHFMNPVPVMQLVEIIRGAATSDETYQATRGLAEKMGKTTVVSRDFPGFIVNRILIPMLNEACYAVMEGIASPEDIDTAMKLGTNQPMGPLALADFIGLDTCLSIAEVLHRGLGDDKYRPCPLLRQYVEAGWVGKKAGRGFYNDSGREDGGMAYETIRLELEGALAILTIDRPKALNAFNTQALQETEVALRFINSNADLRALIVTGAGEKAFVAGADIAEMAKLTPNEAREFAGVGHRVFHLMEALAIPTIAAVNGFALGGGCELALCCDLIYASEKAKFGLPEVGLGVIPGFGGTQRLTRLVGRVRAKEMIFTGEMIDAQKALQIGLCLEVLPPDKLMEHCKAMAGKMSKKGPLAIAQAKRVIEYGADGDLRSANELERQGFSMLFGSEDQREGMAAFLEKRPPAFKGK